LKEKSHEGQRLVNNLDEIINHKEDMHILITKKVKLEMLGAMDEQN
jgi:hypothetical protein